MDTIKTEASKQFFPDERGTLPLYTNKLVTETADGNGGELNSTTTAETDAVPADHCFVNPDLCKDGFSLAFWMKGIFHAMFQTSGFIFNVSYFMVLMFHILCFMFHGSCFMVHVS